MLRSIYIIGLCLLPILCQGQRKTTLGLNLVPLAVNGFEVKLEHHMLRNLSLQAGAGFRLQNRNSGAIEKARLLDRFIHERNSSAFLSAGFRVFDPSLSEYPYMGLQFTGFYNNELYRHTDQELIENKGLGWGFTFNMGYVFNLGKRLSLDLGMQIGYAPPRSKPDFYYYPGIGFTTLGLDVIGYRGGHIQPMACISYTIVRDPRSRILEQE